MVDARPWAGIEIDVFGNGERYNLHLRTADVVHPGSPTAPNSSRRASGGPSGLPFATFEAHRVDAPIDLARLRRVGVVAIGRAFTADVAISRLRVYR